MQENTWARLRESRLLGRGNLANRIFKHVCTLNIMIYKRQPEVLIILLKIIHKKIRELPENRLVSI